MTLVSLLADEINASLPTPRELEEEIPFTNAHAAFVMRSRETVEAILNRWDPRRLLIVGPCSIHDLNAAREYAAYFRDLAAKVRDKFYLIMRAYFEKPRTVVGWKGLLYDPDLDGSFNLIKGVRQTRQLLSDLTEMGIPVGCELLELNTSPYYSDFLTWGCVGARTSASPPHRQLASSLSFPIGFKNSTDGNIDPSIHGILAAQIPQVYLGISASGQISRIQGEGNPLCHMVLRGGVHGSNFHREAIAASIQKCRQAKIRDKIVVDCSHDNCEKKHLKQIPAFESVMRQIREGNDHLVGLMLESNLKAGAQKLSSNLEYGISITDPCLDWETTERLILNECQ